MKKGRLSEGTFDIVENDDNHNFEKDKKFENFDNNFLDLAESDKDENEFLDVVDLDNNSKSVVEVVESVGMVLNFENNTDDHNKFKNFEKE